MHPAQRHAFIAIITMLEQGLQQLKGLILTPAETHVRPTQPKEEDTSGYLSEESERQLEVLMERDREEALRARKEQIALMFEEE